MNRTQVLGFTSFTIGYVGIIKYPEFSLGGILLLTGLLLIWNGGVASYNRDIDFAIFG